MMRFTAAIRSTAYAMALVMVVVSLPIGAAQAGMVSTDQVIDRAEAQQDRVVVLGFLGREDVRGQMRALGVDADEAAARIDSLSDTEIARIAGQIEELPAGQSAAGTIIGVAVLIFAILLITDILGVTNVFSFVNSNQ